MEFNNKLNEVPVAELKNQELEELQKLEKKLGEKYYIIAFENKKKQ